MQERRREKHKCSRILMREREERLDKTTSHSSLYILAHMYFKTILPLSQSIALESSIEV